MIPFQEEFWPFYTTLSFRYFKKSFKTCNRFPDIPLRVNFRISHSCQTLSKAFDMSKNTPLTSRSLSKDCYISWVIERSWLIEESPGRKPDWLDDNKSFSFKNLYSSLNKSLSKIRLEAKRQVGNFWYTVHHFLWIGTTLAFFHSIRNFIWLRHDLKIIERGVHKERPHSFNIRILIISWPGALLGSRLFIIFNMFSFGIWTLLRRFSVRNSKLFGNSLLFF